MRSVGVRELRKRMSEILEEVSARGEEISVTNHGKEVARLLPPRRRRSEEDLEHLWQRIDRIAGEIAAYPARGLDASEAVREERE